MSGFDSLSLNSYGKLLDNDLVNSTVTLATITGLDQNVSAGDTYRFKFYLIYTAAATTTGARFVTAGAALTSLFANSRWPLTATTQTVNNFSAHAIPAAANASSLLTGNVAVIKGVVTPSETGVLSIQFASEIAASAITVKAGSWSEISRLINV